MRKRWPRPVDAGGGDLEERDPDEGQRPPAPRREGQGDEEARRERGEEPAHQGVSCRHGRQETPGCGETLHRRREGRVTPGRGGRRSARASTPAGGRRTAWPDGRGSGRRSTARSGGTISVESTRYVKRPAPVVKITSSPGARSSRLRKSWLWLTRWPATTTLPTSPGIAVPGQCPGPRSSVDRRMPSWSVRCSPIAGISIEPSSTRGSLEPSSAGAAIGTGSSAGSVVGGSVVGGSVVGGSVVGGQRGRREGGRRRRAWSTSSSAAP